MPIRVNVPGVGTVNFPDGMSEDDISQEIERLQPQAAPEPDATTPDSPSISERLFGRQPDLSREQFIADTEQMDRERGEQLEQNAPSIMGTLASMATGGLGAIPAMLSSGGASGLTRLISNAASGQDRGNPLTTGVASAAAEGAGRGIGALAQGAGRMLYRAGAMPTVRAQQKYGDLVGAGIEEGVPITQGGLKKITSIKNNRLDNKQQLLKAAGEKMSIRPQAVADDTLLNLVQTAEAQRKAAMGDPTEKFAARAKLFLKENPTATPESLEAIKRTLDARTGGAHMKVRMREPVSPKDEFGMSLARSIGNTQEQAVPGYRAMNQDIRMAEGLRQMVDRRLNGSNQGIENAAAMFMGPAGLPARLLMLPQVLSSGGIAANRAGKIPQGYAAMLRAAVLDLMKREDDDR